MTEYVPPKGNVKAQKVFIEHIADLKDQNTLAVKRVFFEGIVHGSVGKSV